MITALLGALGVDAVQFRALLIAYLKTDWRAGGGAMRAGEGSRGGAAIAGLLLVMAIGSVALTLVVAVTEDPLLAAAMLTSYGAANTMMMLLVDFTGVVVAPEDYGVLGHRPVGSRTYFAARMTSVAAYIGAMSLVLALAPSLAFAFARHLGPLVIPATLVAVASCNLTLAVFVIAGFLTLLGHVHLARIRRATTYLQLVVVMLFYVAYYLGTTGFQHSFLQTRRFADAPLMWLNPAAWFAAIIPVAGGEATAGMMAASAAAMALTAIAVPIAAGRLSLDYARRLGEISAAAEPIRGGVRPGFQLPGFSRNEARAVALLVRGQFSFDNRFRMAVLGIVPLTAFYCLLDPNAFVDPFTEQDAGSGVAIYFAIVFVPITLHMAMNTSESWRAGWIFFALPAAHARLVLATKNFVAVHFLGAYLMALAVLWSVFYQRVWHAVVHTVFIGAIAHLLLQLAVTMKPSLPFAAEPKRGDLSSGVVFMFLAAGMAAGVLPAVLPFIYARPTLAVTVFAVLIAATAALEYALRQRAEEVAADLEFMS